MKSITTRTTFILPPPVVVLDHHYDADQSGVWLVANVTVDHKPRTMRKLVLPRVTLWLRSPA